MKTLYLLDNEHFALVEIKRTDLPRETDKSKVYFWFLLQKSPLHIQKLDFVAMHSNETVEERIFQQGKLRFTKTEGVYKTKEKRYPLNRLAPNTLPEEYVQAIRAFFRQF